MNNEIFTANVYDNEFLTESRSLTGAVRALATAWHCPFESLHTEQCGSVWTVYGPEDQFIGTITVG